MTELSTEGSLWKLALGVNLSQSFSLLAGQLCGGESKPSSTAGEHSTGEEDVAHDGNVTRGS